MFLVVLFLCFCWLKDRGTKLKNKFVQHIFAVMLENNLGPNKLYFDTVNTRENDTIVVGVIYNKTVAGVRNCFFKEQQILITYGEPPEANVKYVHISKMSPDC